MGQTLRNFFALIQRQFHGSIEIVRSDNGTEFTCSNDYFVRNGIIHQTSCVRTPQKIEGWNLNIDTYLTWHMHSVFKQTCLLNFGENVC